MNIDTLDVLRPIVLRCFRAIVGADLRGDNLGSDFRKGLGFLRLFRRLTGARRLWSSLRPLTLLLLFLSACLARWGRLRTFLRRSLRLFWFRLLSGICFCLLLFLCLHRAKFLLLLFELFPFLGEGFTLGWELLLVLGLVLLVVLVDLFKDKESLDNQIHRKFHIFFWF